MNILGISAYYHDSSAALIVDGVIVAGALEERYSRIKHDNSFPVNACKFCLEYANLSIGDIDAVVFYEKPFVKFERIIRTHINYAPKGLKMFLLSMPIWLKERFNMRQTIKREIKNAFGTSPDNIKFVDHHLSHASNAFFQSRFSNSAILVIDAVGEDCTTSIYKANDSKIELIQKQCFPNSIGLLYSSFTYYLGFKVNSDEYKVMGLASYGNIDDTETQRFIDTIKQRLVKINEDGSIIINDDCFTYMYTDRMVDEKLWLQIFGIGKREPQTELTQSHKNLALAIQSVTEEIVLKLIHTAKILSNSNNLCLSGGCAMNCVVNGKLLKTKEFDQIYIPYAPDDSGCSIGAALAYYHLNNSQDREENNNSYLGPEFSNDEVLSSIQKYECKYRCLTDSELYDFVSEKLSLGNIIGWFQGRMEFGPRALGNRSIFADARDAGMKDKINSTIKFRESFRPFAPVVMNEYASELFHNIGGEAKHMSFAYDVKSVEYPAITHIDNTSRVQTLIREDNPKLYALLDHYYRLTGSRLLLNTSFNVMGEPIVCSPDDALRTFMSCGIDVLVMNNYVITKI